MTTTRLQLLRLRRDGAIALARRSDDSIDRAFWAREARKENRTLLVERGSMLRALMHRLMSPMTQPIEENDNGHVEC